MYVDGGTSIPAPLQNGSEACPFSTIGQAIAEIPPVIPSDPADQEQVFLVLIAPGRYVEDLAIPQGRKVSLAGVSGSGSVFIDGTVSIDARVFATTVATPGVGFDGLQVLAIEIDADGSTVTPFTFVVLRFTGVASVMDVGLAPWEGALVTERSDVPVTSVPGAFFAAQDAGLYGSVLCSLIQATDQFFFTVALTAPTEALTRLLQESVIAISLTAPLTHTIQLDTETSYFVESADALSPTQARNVVNNVATARKHLLPQAAPLPYVMTARDSAVRVTSAAPGGTVTLPPLATAGSLSATAALVQERVVRNHSTSTDPITVIGFGGEPIEGGPVLLAPGEAAILIPGETLADWMLIGRSP
jgi:hypothetical protein